MVKVSRYSIDMALSDLKTLGRSRNRKIALLLEENFETDGHWLLWMHFRMRSYTRHAAYMAAGRLAAWPANRTPIQKRRDWLAEALKPFRNGNDAERQIITDMEPTDIAQALRRRLSEFAFATEAEQLDQSCQTRPLAASLTGPDDALELNMLYRHRTEVRSVAVEAAALLGNQWVEGEALERLNGSAQACSSADHLLAKLVAEQPLPAQIVQSILNRFYAFPAKAQVSNPDGPMGEYMDLLDEAGVTGRLLHPGHLPWLTGQGPDERRDVDAYFQLPGWA
jgi:hypothetical protein